MLNVSGGMPMSLGGSTVFTPRAGMAYTMLKTDTYTETGGGNLNQTVSTDDVSAFILSIGGKLHTSVKTENGSLIPSLHAGLSYDVSGEEVVSQSTFTGVGAATTTNTGLEVEQFAGNFGAGLAYQVDEASVGFTYDLSMKDGFSAHSGMLEAQFKF
jgi:outer membrane autotransporter protein